MIHIPRDWTAHESEPEDSQHLLIASSEIVRKRLMFAEQLTIARAKHMDVKNDAAHCAVIWRVLRETKRTQRNSKYVHKLQGGIRARL